MRSTIILHLLATLVVSLAGCGSSDDASSDGCRASRDCAVGLSCSASGQCIPTPAGGGGSGGSGGQGGSGGAAGSEAVSPNLAADEGCSVLPQGGCGEGHTCLVANTSGRTSCYTAGSQPYAAACGTINDCAPGLLCLGGQCRALCASAADCPSAPYAICSPFRYSSGATLPGLSWCSLQCNPADPTNQKGAEGFEPCGAGLSCLWSSSAPTGTTSCYTGGTLGQGKPCASVDDCAPGLICLGSNDGTSRCEPLCLMDGSKCPSGSCQSFGEPQQVHAASGLVEIGYCQ